MILLQANQVARHFGSETLFENIHLEKKVSHHSYFKRLRMCLVIAFVDGSYG